MQIIISLAVCIAGCLIYALSGNPKVAELGRIGFFAGLFVTLMVFSKAALNFP